MKFKIGFMLGAAVGYVAGTKAGRERYDQIVAYVRKLMGSEPVQTAAEKGKAVVDLTSQRVRTSVGEAIHDVSDRFRHPTERVSAEA